jgi:hypothetical protein
MAVELCATMREAIAIASVEEKHTETKALAVQSILANRKLGQGVPSSYALASAHVRFHYSANGEGDDECEKRCAPGASGDSLRKRHYNSLLGPEYSTGQSLQDPKHIFTIIVPKSTSFDSPSWKVSYESSKGNHEMVTFAIYDFGETHTMQISCKTVKPAYWFWISIRAHGDVMRAVPHINSRSLRMNHLQAWLLGL